jgi:hypothetical protein
MELSQKKSTRDYTSHEAGCMSRMRNALVSIDKNPVQRLAGLIAASMFRKLVV